MCSPPEVGLRVGAMYFSIAVVIRVLSAENYKDLVFKEKIQELDRDPGIHTLPVRILLSDLSHHSFAVFWFGIFGSI